MTAHPDGPPDDQLMTALRELCLWIEEIATRWQDPEERVRLLDLSGQVLFLSKDHRPAARYWMQALEITRAHELRRATDARASILTSLSELYHATQRPLKALEVERELVSLHEASEQATFAAYDLATALARLGATLIDTGQFDAGGRVLTRADQALQALGAPTPQLARTHVRVLELLATVHRHRDQPDQARSCEAHAIEMAALPLVAVTDVIHELNTTVANAVDQLAILAPQVATVVDAVGDEGHPQPTGLAQVPGMVAIWHDVVGSIENLAFHLRRQVRVIASAAGHKIAGPRERTQLDVLAELAEWAAYTAKVRGESTVLIELRNRAARIFYDAEDFRRAQAHWDWALEHADQLTASALDPTTAATARATGTRILETRSDLAHTHDRLHEAIDIETRLLDRHRDADDQPATARALARLGATMATVGQHDQAQEYLTEADIVFQALGHHDPDTAKSHADTLELLATVRNHHGRHAEPVQRRQEAEALRTPTPHPAGQP